MAFTLVLSLRLVDVDWELVTVIVVVKFEVVLLRTESEDWTGAAQAALSNDLEVNEHVARPLLQKLLSTSACLWLCPLGTLITVPGRSNRTTVLRVPLSQFPMPHCHTDPNGLVATVTENDPEDAGIYTPLASTGENVAVPTRS